MDAGIKYIKIIEEKNDFQFILADVCFPFTEPILREMFNNSGMELLPGLEIIECKRDELKARYDLYEGIDLILYFKDNTRGTLQQKILFTDFHTATFEEIKNSGKPGAWYYCTAQYYFVIYTKENRAILQEQYKNNSLVPTMREAVLLNLPEVHRLSLNNNIAWWPITRNYNYRSNAFRSVEYSSMPLSCIISTWPIYKNEDDLKLHF